VNAVCGVALQAKATLAGHAQMPLAPAIDEAADPVHLPAAWRAGAAVTMRPFRRFAAAMSDLPSPVESPAPEVPPPATPAVPPAATPTTSSAPAQPEPAAAAAMASPERVAAAAGSLTELNEAAAAGEASAASESVAGSDADPACESAPAPENAPAPPLMSSPLPSPAPSAAPSPAVVDLSPAACAARLAELFPALFGAGRALPIKLRIQNDIQQRAPGVFTRKSLSPFLHRYTTSTAYLKALVHSPHRFDLDGAPAGDIDDVHRQAAATELERRRGLFEAKRAAERAAANEARRAAEAAARQQHAAEDQARRERAALLRAFESSTLTRANFCVLKGIPETELDGRLHQAWLEREQRTQELRAAGGAPSQGEGHPPRAPRSPGAPGPRPAPKPPR